MGASPLTKRKGMEKPPYFKVQTNGVYHLVVMLQGEHYTKNRKAIKESLQLFLGHPRKPFHAPPEQLSTLQHGQHTVQLCVPAVYIKDSKSSILIARASKLT